MLQLIIWMLIITHSLFFISEASPIRFRRIASDQGLSQNTVYSIEQDHVGFLWIGTNNGLNRYDGYQFVVFKKKLNDSLSISDNTIISLLEDSHNRLWVGTYQGLNRYNHLNQTFRRYAPQTYDSTKISGFSIWAIQEDKKGRLWIGTGNGLNLYNEEKECFSRYTWESDSINGLNHNEILDIFEDCHENLWLGTGDGLCHFDPEHRRFTNYKPRSSVAEYFSVWSIQEDSTGQFWIGTQRGLFRFDPKNGLFFKSDLIQLNQLHITQLFRDALHRLWIATEAGLYLYHPETRLFSVFKSDPFDPSSLSDNIIWSLFEDRSHNIWIGTGIGGLNQYSPWTNKFATYNQEGASGQALSNRYIVSLLEDHTGALWIGTRSGGLNRLDRQSDTYTWYQHNFNDANSLAHNRVNALCEDFDGSLWIGTANGLTQFNRQRNQFKQFHANDPNVSISHNNIQTLFLGADSTLWIGTYFGLSKLSPDRKKFSFYNYIKNTDTSLSNHWVHTITADDNGKIWIGTDNGLNCLDPRTRQIKHYYHDPDCSNSLSHNLISALIYDSPGVLWIGTYGGGLNRLEVKTGKFTRFTNENGLPSNEIAALVMDNYGNLWISSDNGLIRFNTYTLQSIVFTTHDGLQSNEFCYNSVLKSKNGELFFGGINGFNSFFPQEIAFNRSPPPIVITSFKIYNRRIELDSPSIETRDTIKISDQDKYFSIEFAALDFSQPLSNQFLYKLEGFDNEWFNLTNRNFVNYTNLSSGKYTFCIKGANNDGVWSKTTRRVTLIIMPSYWNTWWFKMIAIVTTLSIIGVVIINRLQYYRSIAKIRTKIAADLHDTIGSGLTEIVILSQLAQNYYTTIDSELKNSSLLQSNLESISVKAGELVEAMSDIVWLINPNQRSLYALVLRLKDSYCGLLSQSAINFKTENITLLEKMKLPVAIRQNIYLIFKEAINNSIKYSRCKNILIKIEIKSNKLNIMLSDDGIGMNVNQSLGRGNGLENMLKRAKTIDSSLEILSHPGAGTKIHLYCHLKRSFLSYNER